MSAFESASDHVLAQLDKGHTVADEIEAVAVLRSRRASSPARRSCPSPRGPTPADIVDLLDLVARCDLVGNVDPVHFAIRLLVPPGSLLLRRARSTAISDAYDDEHLGWTWQRAGPPPRRVQRRARRPGRRGRAPTEWPAQRSYDAVRAAARDHPGRRRRPGGRAAVRSPTTALRSALAPDDRPRLTEAWFCCAEPTDAQIAAPVHVETDWRSPERS